MFFEPMMTASLQVIFSEICHKMSVVPAVISRVPERSRKQKPSIPYILDLLQELVANIKKSNVNTLSDIKNNNLTWDVSHDFPLYPPADNSDYFIDIEEILGGSILNVSQTSEGVLDVSQNHGRVLEVPEKHVGGLDPSRTLGEDLDFSQTRVDDQVVPNIIEEDLVVQLTLGAYQGPLSLTPCAMSATPFVVSATLSVLLSAAHFVSSTARVVSATACVLSAASCVVLAALYVMAAEHFLG